MSKRAAAQTAAAPESKRARAAASASSVSASATPPDVHAALPIILRSSFLPPRNLLPLSAADKGAENLAFTHAPGFLNLQGQRGGRLHCAASQGSVSRVQALITAGGNIFALNRSGSTPAQIAFDACNLHAVQPLSDALVAKGVAAAEEYNRYALHRAAADGDVAGVVAALAAGADVHAYSRDGFQALHLCAENGHDKVLEKLLAAGASVTSTARDGSNALSSITKSLTVVRGRAVTHLKTLSLLLAYAESLQQLGHDGATSLMKALGDDNRTQSEYNCAELLLSRGLHLFKQVREEDADHTPLTFALSEGYARLAVSISRKLDMRGLTHKLARGWETPLILACWKGSSEPAMELIRRGVPITDRDKDGFSALSYAANNELTDVCRRIIQAGMQQGMTNAQLSAGLDASAATFLHEHRLLLPVTGAGGGAGMSSPSHHHHHHSAGASAQSPSGHGASQGAMAVPPGSSSEHL